MTASRVTRFQGLLAVVVVFALAAIAAGIWFSARKTKAPQVSAPEPRGYRLERVGFDDVKTVPFLDLTTALAGYAYLDFDGDRYEAGRGGWILVSKGAAKADEHWLVRETLLSVDGEGRTMTSNIEVVEVATGDVLASRKLKHGQVEGSPPTGWVHRHAQAFVQQALGRKDVVNEPMPTIAWSTAKLYEQETGERSLLNLSVKGDGCPAAMKVTYRHFVARLDVGTWELIPRRPLYNDFACSAEHVAVFSGIYSELEVTIASLDGAQVFAFELDTLFDWAREPKLGRTIGHLKVDDGFVQFEVQEWLWSQPPKLGARTPVRRLLYKVPIELVRN